MRRANLIAGNKSLYSKDIPDSLTCPKCHQAVDYLLGEEETLACEKCYQPSGQVIEVKDEPLGRQLEDFEESVKDIK